MRLLEVSLRLRFEINSQLRQFSHERHAVMLLLRTQVHVIFDKNRVSERLSKAPFAFVCRHVPHKELEIDRLIEFEMLIT